MWKCSCQEALSCFQCAHKYGNCRSHPCKMPSRAPSEQMLLWNLSSPFFWLFFTHHLDFCSNPASAFLPKAEPRGPHHGDSPSLWVQGCWVVVVQLLSCVWLFVTPRTAAWQAFLSFTISQFAQTHVHWVGDAIQPSHPLPPPSSPAQWQTQRAMQKDPTETVLCVQLPSGALFLGFSPVYTPEIQFLPFGPLGPQRQQLPTLTGAGNLSISYRSL